MFDIDCTRIDWTEAERKFALAVLEKILRCQNEGGDRPLPPDVFELHCKTKVNVSTELVLYDGNGAVYLIKRPSHAENPTDPYAGLWHCPGVTWNKGESLEDTFNRLEKTEGVSFTEPVRRDVRVTQDDKRGTYLSCIYVALATQAPTNPSGKFFPIEDIPWGWLVEHHASVILPAVGIHRSGQAAREVVRV